MSVRARVGAYVSFAGLGVTAAAVPAATPSLANSLGVPSADALTAIPALFGGLLVGVVLAPSLALRWHLARIIAFGCVVQAVALAAISRAGGVLALVVAAAVAGVGFGAVESAGAAFARQLSRSGASRSLVSLTAVVAVAAGSTPLAVVAAGDGGVRQIVALCAAPHVVAALILVRVPGTSGPDPRDGPLREPAAGSALWPVRWLAGALFCYVGAETVIAGWSAELPRSRLGLDASQAALGTTSFWCLLTLGRTAALWLLACGAPPARVLVGSQSGAILALILAAGTWDTAPAVSVVFLGIAATALGPCYALLVGSGVDEAPGSMAPRVSAALVGVGALGGSVVAAATAGLSEALPRAPVVLPAAAMVVSCAAVACHLTPRSRLRRQSIGRCRRVMKR